jgi:hypothetical protein
VILEQHSEFSGALLIAALNESIENRQSRFSNTRIVKSSCDDRSTPELIPLSESLCRAEHGLGLLLMLHFTEVISQVRCLAIQHAFDVRRVQSSLRVCNTVLPWFPLRPILHYAHHDRISWELSRDYPDMDSLPDQKWKIALKTRMIWQKLAQHRDHNSKD